METIETKNKTDAEIVQSVMGGYKNSVSSKLLKDLGKDKASESGTVKRLLNLTGPRTLEGRLKSQSNLKRGSIKREEKVKKGKILFNPDNPMDCFFIDDKEKQFYEERKEKYVDEYSLNESVDRAILDQILQEEIVLNRLSMQQRDYFLYLRSTKEEKSKIKSIPPNPTDEINAARRRFKEATNLLAAGKKDRKTHNENVGNDLASLALRFNSRGLLDDDDDIKKEIQEVDQYLKTSNEKRNEALAELGLEE